MNRRGVALPMVLWGVAFLSGVVVLLAVRMSQRIDDESHAERMFRARQLALRGLALARHPEIREGDPLLRSGSEETEGYSVVLTDESARLNPNVFLEAGRKEVLRRLFLAWGARDADADAATDSLVDWTDGDELRSLAGAERSEYAAAGIRGLPPNAPLADVSEMESVMNLRDLLLDKPGWRDLFTVLHNGRVNVNHASEEMLMLLGGLTAEQAARIRAYRDGPDGRRGTLDDLEIESIEDAIALAGASGAAAENLRRDFGVEGGLRRIESTGFCGGVECRIAIVVSEDGGQLLAWEER